MDRNFFTIIFFLGQIIPPSFYRIPLINNSENDPLLTIINHVRQCSVQLRILGVNAKCSPNMASLRVLIQVLLLVDYG